MTALWRLLGQCQHAELGHKMFLMPKSTQRVREAGGKEAEGGRRSEWNLARYYLRQVVKTWASQELHNNL